MAPKKPEEQAREDIDRQLTDAAWIVQDSDHANLSAAPGVALGELPTATGPADYGFEGLSGAPCAAAYEGTKRDVADALVSLLAEREVEYQDVLINLRIEVSRFRDFPA